MNPQFFINNFLKFVDPLHFCFHILINFFKGFVWAINSFFYLNQILETMRV
uniref:Candidate secreted effector n=1 Tax=Meloidogyne incognita TaxID=6306 RepID=A0A914KTL8_MELIC